MTPTEICVRLVLQSGESGILTAEFIIFPEDAHIFRSELPGEHERGKMFLKQPPGFPKSWFWWACSILSTRRTELLVGYQRSADLSDAWSNLTVLLLGMPQYFSIDPVICPMVDNILVNLATMST